MPIKFICDIGSNHNQDINRIEKLIITAKKIGCHAVKFQLFKGDKLYAPEFPEKIKEAQTQELPIKFIPKIFAICHAHNIEFHCTPFNLEAVEILKPYVNQFKIGSYEILNHALIKACATTGKPLGIALGNWINEEELISIRELTRQIINPNYLIIYHCISEYPAKIMGCQMGTSFNLLKDFFNYNGFNFGWSDHTVQPGVIYAAVGCGVDCIEFHLDLEDGQGLEYKYGHCWKPLQIQSVIETVRIMELALNKPIQEKFYSDIYKWRSDPEDGMRPLKEFRKELSQKEFLEDITD